jgi:hypothetical protein
MILLQQCLWICKVHILLADDVIPGEESVFYDLEDPPMNWKRIC